MPFELSPDRPRRLVVLSRQHMQLDARRGAVVCRTDWVLRYHLRCWSAFEESGGAKSCSLVTAYIVGEVARKGTRFIPNLFAEEEP